MATNNPGRLPNFRDAIAAQRAGYITVDQAADLHPKIKEHLKKKKWKGSSDVEVINVNNKVDGRHTIRGIEGNSPKGKNFYI